MLNITIPGYGELQLAHLVLDYNGTLACDGQLLPGVAERLDVLSAQLSLHVLTADTFGNVKTALAAASPELFILPRDGQDVGKRNYVEKLGADATVCIGNGRNDRLMLQAAALGIAVIQAEGASVAAAQAADVVVSNIQAGLDLLLHPLRLVATLRA
ncbi:MAG: ATPase P [Anaerolineae bacterium]|nr:ATPase P [Anaerolineae bacterium]